MILKGNQRANGRELAMHLLNVYDNEHAVVHDLRGFLSDDLIDAFKETEAISLGTKCQQYLFSLSLNPPMSAKVSVQEFERAIDEIERRLGFTDQPRAVVFHEKNGRRHAHCVWSRIDVDRMRAINLPHFKRRLMDKRPSTQPAQARRPNSGSKSNSEELRDGKSTHMVTQQQAIELQHHIS